MASVQRGGRKGVRAKCKESAKCDHWDLGGNGCKDTIVFFILPSQL